MKSANKSSNQNFKYQAKKVGEASKQNNQVFFYSNEQFFHFFISQKTHTQLIKINKN